MQITKTTHPPAGATALLPAVSPETRAMSWYFLPVVLLSSAFVLVTALIVNNISRRYPVFWWAPSAPVVDRTPSEERPGAPHKEEKPADADDEEANIEVSSGQQSGMGILPAR